MRMAGSHLAARGRETAARRWQRPRAVELRRQSAERVPAAHSSCAVRNRSAAAAAGVVTGSAHNGANASRPTAVRQLSQPGETRRRTSGRGNGECEAATSIRCSTQTDPLTAHSDRRGVKVGRRPVVSGSALLSPLPLRPHSSRCAACLSDPTLARPAAFHMLGWVTRRGASVESCIALHIELGRLGVCWLCGGCAKRWKRVDERRWATDETWQALTVQWQATCDGRRSGSPVLQRPRGVESETCDQSRIGH